MATIEIDGKLYEVAAGQMLIAATDSLGIDIPRFCYHEKLSVAANCRMCLVEVEKAPKLMPACATPVTDGMKVWTKSAKVIAAQKAVMEFLLINHPLDCPICDQAGECELQDIALKYANNSSRYTESKRAVADQDIGPLISTDMARCIHCLRCVRFSIEVAGIQEIGAIGRGQHTLVGTYISKTIDSELSGNMIDICPVGALTAKPSRFSLRTWELQQVPGISAHDSLGSNLYYHVHNNKIVRVVPRKNNDINESWLSDRDRFSYLGLVAEDRLTSPLIKEGGLWKEVDWKTALTKAFQYITSVSPDKIGFLASPQATVEELYLFQKIAATLNCSNLDHRLHQVDLYLNPEESVTSSFEITLNDLENADTILILGGNLRNDIPLLNYRIRKSVSYKKSSVIILNPSDFLFNYPVSHKLIEDEEKLVYSLVAITKGLAAEKSIQLPEELLSMIGCHDIQDKHIPIIEKMLQAKNFAIIVGNIFSHSPYFSLVRALVSIISMMTNGSIMFAGDGPNSQGAYLAGVHPERGVGGCLREKKGKNIYQMSEEKIDGLVLLNIESDLDCKNGAYLTEITKNSNFVLSFTGYKTQFLLDRADILLPIGLPGEIEGTYINSEGSWQSFCAAISPPGLAKSGWKVLHDLGILLNNNDFTYQNTADILDDLRQHCTSNKISNKWIGKFIDISSVNFSLESYKMDKASPYFIDPIVRRSHPLQLRTIS